MPRLPMCGLGAAAFPPRSAREEMLTLALRGGLLGHTKERPWGFHQVSTLGDVPKAKPRTNPFLLVVTPKGTDNASFMSLS